MCVKGGTALQNASGTARKSEKNSKMGNYSVYFQQNCCTFKIMCLFLQNLKSTFIHTIFS